MLTKSLDDFIPDENDRKSLHNSMQNSVLLDTTMLDTPIINKRKEYKKLVNNLVNNLSANKTPKMGLNYLNICKNRYTDIIPVEETRVKLLNVENNYINANYISYDKFKYISTQSPLPNTIADFWKMVWDQKSSVIIMLTNFIENNRVKAELYWNNCKMEYDDIELSIDIENVINLDVGVLRIIKLTQINPRNKDQTIRYIHHIQYTEWGDHKEPSSIKDIKLLIGYMELYKCLGDSKGHNGPPIIHCSAGVGRSGTFIACTIVKQISYYKTPNISDIVAKIRKCRDGMVQTSNQYNFIYKFFETL